MEHDLLSYKKELSLILKYLKDLDKRIKNDEQAIDKLFNSAKQSIHVEGLLNGIVKDLSDRIDFLNDRIEFLEIQLNSKKLQS